MAAEGVARLTLAEAVALHGRLRAPVQPATLHPAYLQADAQRDARLQPAWIAYRSGADFWMHGLHLVDVPGTQLRDGSSPYGYGGPVASTADPAFLRSAWAAYAEWMRGEQVVVEYVRFHPLLANEGLYGGAVIDDREVVCVDLADEPAAAYAPRLRQTLKKAARAGLQYSELPLAAVAGDFGAYHRAAMREMGAGAFYLFDDGYFETLAATGLARVGVCTRAGAGAAWLAAALFLDGPGVREYHLAAAAPEGRPWGASSFVLHSGALAARAQGARKLYLGGGTDRRPDNPLLFFKASFAPSRLTYRTGSAVFDAGCYEALKQRFEAGWRKHPERPIFYRDL